MKRIAAIDVGTNCALLLVADVSQTGQITPIYDYEKIIRLGDGVDRTGILKEDAITRAMEVLKDYAETSEEFKVETILLSGTSAVRDARNRDDLLEKIKSKCGLQMHVLSGEEEAQLTYIGALSNKTDLSGQTLMLDIGGGSSEFILGEGTNIKQMLSLNIGSVRFTERFVTTDPISQNEYGDLVEQIDAVLQERLSEWCVHDISSFVAIAGTATTLAAMHLKMEIYSPKKVDGLSLSMNDLEVLIELFRKSTTEEISKMPGINPERAGVILPGAVILKQAMQFFNKETVIVSDRGLRFGLVIDYLNIV